MLVEKKYRLGKYNEETGLYRVVALLDFWDIKKGDVGGWVESEANLSHKGDCWVAGEAKVFGAATVLHNALVLGHATVKDSATVYNGACIQDDAVVTDDARVYNTAVVRDSAKVIDHAYVCEGAILGGDAVACGVAKIQGNILLETGEFDEHTSFPETQPEDLSLKYVILDKAETGGYEEDDMVFLKERTLEGATTVFQEACQEANVQEITPRKNMDDPFWSPRRMYLCEIKTVSPTNQEIEDFKNKKITDEEKKVRQEELAFLEKLKEKYERD